MRIPYKDLTGLSFGLLIVQRRADTPEGKKQRTYWAVRCSCGKEKVIRQETLTSGRAKSCGCASQRFKKAKMEKRFSLVNQRFGRLMVVWRAETKKRVGQKTGFQARWACKCDCGNIVNVDGRSLRNGKTQSCGCLLRDLWLPKGQAARNTVLARYKKSAQKANLPWELSDAKFDQLVQGNCHYCGGAPSRVARHKGCNGEFICNGIDRVNSKLGYVESNVVSCCYPCNLMKHAMSQEAFIAHVRKILSHWDNKNTLKANV